MSDSPSAFTRTVPFQVSVFQQWCTCPRHEVVLAMHGVQCASCGLLYCSVLREATYEEPVSDA